MYPRLNLSDFGKKLEVLPQKFDQSRIDQLGFLVDDVQIARRECGRNFGIKYWYIPQIKESEIYNGQSRLDQNFTIAIGYANGVQIEVFRVDGQDNDILYGNKPAEDLTLHHVGFFVGDVELNRDGMRKRNIKEIQNGQFSFARRSRTKFAYFDTADLFGVNIEFIENRFRNRRVDMRRWFIWSAALFGVVEISRQKELP